MSELSDVGAWQQRGLNVTLGSADCVGGQCLEEAGVCADAFDVVGKRSFYKFLSDVTK